MKNEELMENKMRLTAAFYCMDAENELLPAAI